MDEEQTNPLPLNKATSAVEKYLGDAAQVSATGVEAFDRVKTDRDNVRAIRDSRRVCRWCTFCGRCKKGSKRRPVNVEKLDSL